MPTLLKWFSATPFATKVKCIEPNRFLVKMMFGTLI